MDKYNSDGFWAQVENIEGSEGSVYFFLQNGDSEVLLKAIRVNKRNPFFFKEAMENRRTFHRWANELKIEAISENETNYDYAMEIV